MATTPPVVLTIAGFDPSSGAGVTADIKTIAAHGCFGVACITALTVQTTTGVKRVEPVDPHVVAETLCELASDFSIAAVHIGMLGSGVVVRVVVDFLRRQTLKNVVLDPVIRSSSGAELLDREGVDLLCEELIPLADVVTPNVDEAAALSGTPVGNLEQMKAAASNLHAAGARALVITGGHLIEATDLLSVKQGGEVRQEVFQAERLISKSTHGTGCAFSCALACQLALGKGLSEVVGLAKQYVTEAIRQAYPLGHGTGPVDHFYRRK